MALGVKNLAGETQLLTSLGKVIVNWRLRAGIGAVIQAEDVMSRYNSFLNYKAYSITWQNYLDFLKYMQRVQAQNHATIFPGAFPLSAFQPSEEPDLLEEDEAIVKLDWRNIKAAPGTITDDAEYRLSGGNTCRHSAIRMTRAAMGPRDMGAGVSNQFFKKLPLTATLKRAEHFDDRTQFFYILPQPPGSYDSLPEHTRWIAKKLYRRLDEMIMMQHRNPLTMSKFQGIKGLYQQIMADQETDIVSILKGIRDWEAENRTLIASHRKDHWFHFATATEKMFGDLHRHFSDVEYEVDAHSNGL